MEDLDDILSLIDSINNGLVKNKDYNKNFTRTIVTILKDSFLEFNDIFIYKLSSVEINPKLFEKRISDLVVLFEYMFIVDQIKKLRNNGFDSNFSKLLFLFDIKKLKDYEIIKKIEDKLINPLNSQLGILSLEERNFSILLYDLFIGLKDSSNLIFLLYCIYKFLLNYKLKFNYKKFIILLGINNLETLIPINKLLSQSQLMINDLFLLNLIKHKDKSGKRGCPFVMYEPIIIANYIENITIFAERCFEYAKNNKVDYESGPEKINSIFKEYSFDRDELLKTGFFKIIK